jgi:hypothetical protein
MRNVARAVGLGGLATLIFACAMAAPAVAEPRINVAPIQVEPHISSGVGHPTTPSFKTVVPQNSKSNLGRPVNPTVLNSKIGGGTTTGGGGTIDVTVSDSHSPKLIDPSLRFTFANKPHRSELWEDTATAPPDDDGAGYVTKSGCNETGCHVTTTYNGQIVSQFATTGGGNGFYTSTNGINESW